MASVDLVSPTKLRRCAFGAAALAVLLSAGAKAESELRFVSGQARQNGNVLREVFDDYNARNPAMRVKLEIDNKSDVDTTQKVLADIAAGSPPDAVRITGAVVRAFTDSGRAQPLDECLASSPALAAELNKGLVDSSRVDGKLYAMPWYTTLPALFINNKAFKAAGLDPARPPRTWSELEAAAAKLSDKAAGKFGLLMYMPNTYLFEAQLRSAGGEIVGADGKPAVDGPAGVDVMTFMRGLVAKGYMPAVSPSSFWNESAGLFRSGDVAMMVFSASSFPQYTDGTGLDLSIAPMPVKDGGQTVATTSTNSFVMLATDPARKAATCKALLSLVTPENVSRTVKATFTSPLNNVAVSTPALLGNYYREHPELVTVNAQPSGSWYSMPGKNNSEFLKTFGDIQFEILTGAATPKDGLAKLSVRMGELLSGR